MTFHTDAIGSVVVLSDGKGKVVASYRYSPYGTSYGSRGSGEDRVSSPIRFSGQYLDTESGFYYMRAREYDPSTGRFLETDPLACDAGCTSSYVYADDQPTVKVDPSGEGAMNAAFDIASVEALGSKYHSPRSVWVTFFSNGPWAKANLQPSNVGEHWHWEKISTSPNYGGWRICSYYDYTHQVTPFCKGMGSTKWAYDEARTAHPFSVDSMLIKMAAQNADTNSGQYRGYVFVSPTGKSWPRKDPPGVKITRHYIEAYNSYDAVPGDWPWQTHMYGKGHDVPTVAVVKDTLPLISPWNAGKYVYTVCTHKKTSWMGIYIWIQDRPTASITNQRRRTKSRKSTRL